MSYLYTAENRLETPHNYMYAQFGGAPFLTAYFQSRRNAIQEFLDAVSVRSLDESFSGIPFSIFNKEFSSPLFDAQEKFLDFLGDDATPRPLSGEHGFVDAAEKEIAISLKMSEFAMGTKISTIDLLNAMITLQLQRPGAPSVRLWLDRLVQRFEVTKKLYANYLPGFRKGEGASNRIRPYWLLALSLSLLYVASREIKYLSTLLKVGDLLCSLPPLQVLEEVHKRDFQIVVAAEAVSVFALAQKKGVNIDTD